MIGDRAVGRSTRVVSPHWGRYDGRPRLVHHLPAYVAIERWVAGRTVVVAAPVDTAGALRLRDAGAHVIVVGALPTAAGLECRAGIPELPLAARSVDAVVCIEGFTGLAAGQRQRLLAEAKRVLRDDGLCVVWAPQSAAAELDFWALERELTVAFASVQMMAQMPWQGFSLAPVLDGDDFVPPIVVRESLLSAAPDASHYLALAGGEAAGVRIRELLECVLVPLGAVDVVASDDEDDAMRREAAELAATRAAEQLRAWEAEQLQQRELEQARVVERARSEAAQQLRAETTEQLRVRADELAEVRARLAELDQRMRHRGAELEVARAREVALQHSLDEARAWTESSANELAELRGKADAKIAELRAGLEYAKEQLRTRETDVAVLTRSVHELEQSSLRNGEHAEARARELEERARSLAEARARLEALQEERATLARQLEVVAVERDAARQLTARLENELEHLRRRAEVAEEHLGERSTEASRLAAETAMLRERADQQERALAHARTRADEAFASAVHSAEQGRVQAELAIDRDRLREEIARRTTALEKLEERLWGARDEAQRERIEVVKLGAELERVREQLERSRQVELARTADLERMAAELRRFEVERGDAIAAVHTRDDEIARLRRELDAMASRSDDMHKLRAELEHRARELVEVGGTLEQVRAREADLQKLLRRREQQLVDAGAELERMRTDLDQGAALTSGLQSELEVRMLELEQLAAGVSNLQQQVEALRLERNEADARAVDLQQQLEQLAAERELLRRHLREREQELADVASAQESNGAELFLLRRELETVAESNERLSTTLRQNAPLTDNALEARAKDWPDEALAEIMRLRTELAARGEAELQAARGEDAGSERVRVRQLQLELEIRAQEHEQVLAQLDAAEQRIWEMTDASDRNAARLAAGLAQLEKQREQFDDTLEELEITRGLLAAAQARNVEQERLLASERAKLARVGGDASLELDGVEALFADLDEADRTKDVAPILLPTKATLAQAAERRADAVPTAVADGGTPVGGHASSSSSSGSRPIELRSAPRVVVEPLEDDAWRDPESKEQ